MSQSSLLPLAGGGHVTDLVLPARPWKAIGAVGLLAVLYAAMGAWPPAALLALTLLVLCVELVPGISYLKLNEDGFEVRSYLQVWSCPWSDVAVFEVVRPFGFKSAVVFRLKPGLAGAVRSPALSRWLNDRDGIIPGSYSLSAEPLADLLNDYREGRISDAANARARQEAFRASLATADGRPRDLPRFLRVPGWYLAGLLWTAALSRGVASGAGAFDAPLRWAAGALMGFGEAWFLALFLWAAHDLADGPRSVRKAALIEVGVVALGIAALVLSRIAG